jgi:uncharacterized protein YlxP (DUF503 family)
MNVGVLKISLRISGKASLKDKRQVVKSIITQLKNRYNVSVAEVDDNDKWQLATLGICYISNDKKHTNVVLSKVESLIVNGRFDVEALETRTEIISL